MTINRKIDESVKAVYRIFLKDYNNIVKHMEYYYLNPSHSERYNFLKEIAYSQGGKTQYERLVSANLAIDDILDKYNVYCPTEEQDGEYENPVDIDESIIDKILLRFKKRW